MDDRVMGALILAASIAGIGMYFWLVFLAPSAWAWLTIQISAMAAVGAILLIAAWIGYTLITTPSMEELNVDLEDFDTDEETGEYDSSSNEKAESSTEENLDTNEYQP